LEHVRQQYRLFFIPLTIDRNSAVDSAAVRCASLGGVPNDVTPGLCAKAS
jgi:hypothetical protein